jgi:hypothetical protein
MAMIIKKRIDEGLAERIRLAPVGARFTLGLLDWDSNLCKWGEFVVLEQRISPYWDDIKVFVMEHNGVSYAFHVINKVCVFKFHNTQTEEEYDPYIIETDKDITQIYGDAVKNFTKQGSEYRDIKTDLIEMGTRFGQIEEKINKLNDWFIDDLRKRKLV